MLRVEPLFTVVCLTGLCQPVRLILRRSGELVVRELVEPSRKVLGTRRSALKPAIAMPCQSSGWAVPQSLASPLGGISLPPSILLRTS